MLHPPIESTQYVSFALTQRLVEAGVDPSVGSNHDPYDCQSLRAGFREDEEVLAVVL